MNMIEIPRPDGWDDAREVRLRAYLDRLGAAVRNDDGATAIQVMRELREVEREVALALYELIERERASQVLSALFGLPMQVVAIVELDPETGEPLVDPRDSPGPWGP